MDTMKRMLEGGTLDSVLQCATQRALACGALQPIESALHVIEDGGVHFLVRQLSPLGRQRHAQMDASRAAPDAFTRTMFVARLAASQCRFV